MVTDLLRFVWIDRPIIGGVFARPADRWPAFRREAFWGAYPYFLPCVVAACLSISAFIFASLGLKEVSTCSMPVTPNLIPNITDPSTF